ncbi:MAG: Bifunctional protein HldE [Chlamydiae bacterium]|nr:Bifunctional protein HldE [Chlamydiota bacterium]
MSLSALFSRFKKQNVLVVGDFMMDSYTIGTVRRVSPEAPVIVVNAKSVQKLPGGAGNVVLNLISLGANVTALGRLGDDDVKDQLLDSLKAEKAQTNYLYIQKGYNTPIKNRVIAGNQQIVRVDFEEKDNLSSSLEKEIIADLPKILKSISVVAISDYAKGFLTDNLLKCLIEKSNEMDIPVIVDPKGADFEKYKGAYLIKPNSHEAYLASGYDESVPLDLAANKILQSTQIENIMVTRSSNGISLFRGNKREDFPVKVKEVTDVTGAGDTVLAVLTFALSNGVSVDQAVVLCNLAAAEVIEHLGCARISIKTLAELILNQHLDNKVFSQSYLQVLQFILDHEDFVLLKASFKNTLSPSLFTHIKKIKQDYPDCKVVLYLENDNQDEALIELLASFNEIDFIIRKVDNLQKFCEKHAPKIIFNISDDELVSSDSLKNLVAS